MERKLFRETVSDEFHYSHDFSEICDTLESLVALETLNSMVPGIES